jgi:hypothetical protein
VTHEVIKPVEHHIREERIYREIHNHDVYHRIQPVYETEILPARHFVPSRNGTGLIEVSEDQLECTGPNQRWYIGEREIVTEEPYAASRLTSPKIIGQTQYKTPEGIDRTETTMAHPPTLEDMSGYKGPVLPMYFDEYGRYQEKAPDSEPASSVKRKTLPVNAKVDPKLAEEMVPPREASLQHTGRPAPVLGSV